MRILCLEDDPTAAELMRAVIEEHDRECFLLRVDTHEILDSK